MRYNRRGWTYFGHYHRLRSFCISVVCSYIIDCGSIISVGNAKGHSVSHFAYMYGVAKLDEWCNKVSGSEGGARWGIEWEGYGPDHATCATLNIGKWLYWAEWLARSIDKLWHKERRGNGQDKEQNCHGTTFEPLKGNTDTRPGASINNQKNNHKPRLVITRPGASVNIRTSSVAKKLHHSTMGEWYSQTEGQEVAKGRNNSCPGAGVNGWCCSRQHRV